LVEGAIEEKESEKMNAWYIAGLIACVVVIPFAIVLFLHCYLRKRNKEKVMEEKLAEEAKYMQELQTS